jgi:hypothetical protein
MLALAAWLIIYIPTTLFVTIVMVKDILMVGRKGKGQKL